MGMKELERAVLIGARNVLNNPKLTMSDILEWSSGEIRPVDGEVRVRIPDLAVNVAVKIDRDLRETAQPET